MKRGTDITTPDTSGGQDQSQIGSLKKFISLFRQAGLANREKARRSRKAGSKSRRAVSGVTS
jgi:hypothetical protein